VHVEAIVKGSEQVIALEVKLEKRPVPLLPIVPVDVRQLILHLGQDKKWKTSRVVEMLRRKKKSEHKGMYVR
jgi:hypothetical protein